MILYLDGMEQSFYPLVKSLLRENEFPAQPALLGGTEHLPVVQRLFAKDGILGDSGKFNDAGVIVVSVHAVCLPVSD